MQHSQAPDQPTRPCSCSSICLMESLWPYHEPSARPMPQGQCIFLRLFDFSIPCTDLIFCNAAFQQPQPASNSNAAYAANRDLYGMHLAYPIFKTSAAAQHLSSSAGNFQYPGEHPWGASGSQPAVHNAGMHTSCFATLPHKHGACHAPHQLRNREATEFEHIPKPVSCA